MKNNSPKLYNLKPAKQAFRIAFIYFSLSMLWIIVSDYFYFVASDARIMTLIISSGKGFLYSLVSGSLIFLLLKKYFSSLHTAAAGMEYSNNQYKALADNLNFGIIRRDTFKKSVYYNNTALQMYSSLSGYPETGSLLGKTPRETIKNPVTAGKIDSLLDEVISTGKIISADLEHDEKHFCLTVIPEFNPEGKLVSLLSKVEDKTEEVNNINRLKKSELFSSGLLNSFQGIVYIFDVNTLKNVYANQSLFDILGYSKECVNKLNENFVNNIVHPDDMERFLKNDLKEIHSLGNKDVFENVFRVKDASGKWRWLKSREVVYSRNSEGGVQTLLGTSFDITEQVNIEQSLLKETSYLNSVIEASPLAVFDLDRDGKVVSIWNRAAEQIFGYTRDEAIGKLLPIVDKHMEEEFLNSLITVFQTGEIKGIERTRRKKDGSPIELSISTRALETAEGRVTRIIAYDEDITLRKKYEQEISGYNNYLQLLYDTGLKTVGTLDLKETYSIIIEAVSNIVRSGSVVISSFNKNTDMLKCEAASIEGKMLDVGFLPELKINEPSAGLQSQAITSGKSQIINNYSEKVNEFRDMTFFNESGTIHDRSPENHILPHTAIIIPLKYKDKITGTLQVFSYAPHVFTNTEMRRLEPIAVLIASAAERARLHKNTQDEMEQKKIAFEQIRVLSKGMEQTPNSIIITDSKGGIEYVNPYFSELTGYTLNDVLGKNPSVLKSGNTRTGIYEDLWKTITTGEVWHGEFLNKKKNGELFWESASIGPILDDNDVITNFIAVKQDITEKKLKDTQIRESLAEKEIMLKEIHHRVKNNLQIISSLLNMQLNHYSTPEAIDAINAGRNRVKAMALVHENLYRSANISKTAMDEYIVTLAQNIYSAYGNTFEKVHFTRETGGIEFGLDTVIPLGLIINEAISNSLKHAFPADKSGEISVILKKLQGLKYQLTIKDNGIGLPGNFDPHNTNSLGMTLITSLASQLDGEVLLNNIVGTEMIINFKEIKYKSRV